MLSQLFIQNIAVIEKVQVAFEKGLNVFTGETGAGKSIVIDAINAVLGNRTSRDLVRTGAPKALVTALFEGIGDETKEQLLSMGFEPEEDGYLLLSREISADGKTSCKIGGRPSTVSILREVAQSLINIHGQHDNQSLLLPEQHLVYIDQFGKTAALLKEYRVEYAYYVELQRKLRQLQTDEREKAQRTDLLSYQINEISSAALFPDEEEELQSAKKKIQNSVKIIEALHIAHDLLQGTEESDGILSMLDQTQEQFQMLEVYYPQIKSDRILDMRYELEEVRENLRDALSDAEMDPAELDRIEERLDLIFRLKRKYGGSVEEILARAEEKGEPPFLVLLDGIEDPHNLGAIIRTANLAGAHGVIITRHRAAGLTATAVKASAGAVHYTPVAKVANLGHTIDELKQKGLWFVCADMGGTRMYDLDLKGPIGLVVGNEGEGVSRLVKEKCDFVASIPMKGNIDSLNASVAAGVLAYEIVRQRG